MSCDYAISWATVKYVSVSTFTNILKISGNLGFVEEIFGKLNNSRKFQEIQEYEKNVF